jgi:hypothetical protein
MSCSIRVGEMASAKLARIVFGVCEPYRSMSVTINTKDLFHAPELGIRSDYRTRICYWRTNVI